MTFIDKGPLIVLFISMLTFEGGTLSCYMASNTGHVLLGRALCGIGAAGCASGAEYFSTIPNESQIKDLRNAAIGFTYVCVRFLGPL